MVEPTTIVIVDDVAAVRALAGARLRLSGQFVVVGEAGSGTEAVALAGEHRPDAVLLDVGLPGGMDGLAAIARIREVSADTKVVVYSGLDRPGLAASALELGAVGYVEKSSPIEELPDRVARALAAHRAALRTAEPFRLLVESVIDYAIFMLDPDGYILSWNVGAERIKGYAAGDVIGRHFRLFYTADAQRSGHPEYELTVARKEGRYEEEGWRIRKDGSQFWANVLITAIHDPSGELLGFAKVTRDLTERRELMQELERAAADRAAANARLADANTRLARAAEDKSQFLAVTAHELRTPIRVVTGVADTLAGHWDALDEAERADLLESMRTSAARMTRLLDDLLAATRLEAGALEVRPVPIPVRPPIEDAVAETRTAFPDVDIAIRCDPDVTALADPSRLGQILVNYLTNAARYGRPPVRVEVTATADGVLIEVSDHGPGVPADLRWRLFEKFARGPHDRGTGLGLFVVRQLARSHGGDAWYERRDGLSCFAVRLPAAG